MERLITVMKEIGLYDHLTPQEMQEFEWAHSVKHVNLSKEMQAKHERIMKKKSEIFSRWQQMNHERVVAKEKAEKQRRLAAVPSIAQMRLAGELEEDQNQRSGMKKSNFHISWTDMSDTTVKQVVRVLDKPESGHGVSDCGVYAMSYTKCHEGGPKIDWYWRKIGALAAALCACPVDYTPVVQDPSLVWVSENMDYEHNGITPLKIGFSGQDDVQIILKTENLNGIRDGDCYVEKFGVQFYLRTHRKVNYNFSFVPRFLATYVDDRKNYADGIDSEDEEKLKARGIPTQVRVFLLYCGPFVRALGKNKYFNDRFEFSHYLRAETFEAIKKYWKLIRVDYPDGTWCVAYVMSNGKTSIGRNKAKMWNKIMHSLHGNIVYQPVADFFFKVARNEELPNLIGIDMQFGWNMDVANFFEGFERIEVDRRQQVSVIGHMLRSAQILLNNSTRDMKDTLMFVGMSLQVIAENRMMDPADAMRVVGRFLSQFSEQVVEVTMEGWHNLLALAEHWEVGYQRVEDEFHFMLNVVRGFVTGYGEHVMEVGHNAILAGKGMAERFMDQLKRDVEEYATAGLILTGIQYNRAANLLAAYIAELKILARRWFGLVAAKAVHYKVIVREYLDARVQEVHELFHRLQVVYDGALYLWDKTVILAHATDDYCQNFPTRFIDDVVVEGQDNGGARNIVDLEQGEFDPTQWLWDFEIINNSAVCTCPGNDMVLVFPLAKYDLWNDSFSYPFEMQAMTNGRDKIFVATLPDRVPRPWYEFVMKVWNKQFSRAHKQRENELKQLIRDYEVVLEQEQDIPEATDGYNSYRQSHARHGGRNKNWNGAVVDVILPPEERRNPPLASREKSDEDVEAESVRLHNLADIAESKLRRVKAENDLRTEVAKQLGPDGKRRADQQNLKKLNDKFNFTRDFVDLDGVGYREALSHRLVADHSEKNPYPRYQDWFEFGDSEKVEFQGDVREHGQRNAHIESRFFTICKVVHHETLPLWDYSWWGFVRCVLNGWLCFLYWMIRLLFFFIPHIRWYCSYGLSYVRRFLFTFATYEGYVVQEWVDELLSAKIVCHNDPNVVYERMRDRCASLNTYNVPKEWNHLDLRQKSFNIAFRIFLCNRGLQVRNFLISLLDVAGDDNTSNMGMMSVALIYPFSARCDPISVVEERISKVNINAMSLRPQASALLFLGTLSPALAAPALATPSMVSLSGWAVIQLFMILTFWTTSSVLRTSTFADITFLLEPCKVYGSGLKEAIILVLAVVALLSLPFRYSTEIWAIAFLTLFGLRWLESRLSLKLSRIKSLSLPVLSVLGVIIVSYFMGPLQRVLKLLFTRMITSLSMYLSSTGLGLSQNDLEEMEWFLNLIFLVLSAILLAISCWLVKWCFIVICYPALRITMDWIYLVNAGLTKFLARFLVLIVFISAISSLIYLPLACRVSALLPSAMVSQTLSSCPQFLKDSAFAYLILLWKVTTDYISLTNAMWVKSLLRLTSRDWVFLLNLIYTRQLIARLSVEWFSTLRPDIVLKILMPLWSSLGGRISLMLESSLKPGAYSELKLSLSYMKSLIVQSYPILRDAFLNSQKIIDQISHEHHIMETVIMHRKSLILVATIRSVLAIIPVAMFISSVIYTIWRLAKLKILLGSSDRVTNLTFCLLVLFFFSVYVGMLHMTGWLTGTALLDLLKSIQTWIQQSLETTFELIRTVWTLSTANSVTETDWGWASTAMAFSGVTGNIASDSEVETAVAKATFEQVLHTLREGYEMVPLADALAFAQE